MLSARAPRSGCAPSPAGPSPHCSEPAPSEPPRSSSSSSSPPSRSSRVRVRRAGDDAHLRTGYGWVVPRSDGSFCARMRSPAASSTATLRTRSAVSTARATSLARMTRRGRASHSARSPTRGCYTRNPATTSRRSTAPRWKLRRSAQARINPPARGIPYPACSCERSAGSSNARCRAQVPGLKSGIATVTGSPDFLSMRSKSWRLL